MRSKVATVLVGRQTLFREALTLLLSSANYKHVRSTCSIDELLHGPELKLGSGLFIVSLEAGMKGAEGEAALTEVRMLKQRHPDARLVILSAATDVEDVVAAFRAGADGYIMNTMTSEVLIKALDLVMCGETVVPSEFMRDLCEQERSIPHEVGLPLNLNASRAEQRPAYAHSLSSKEAAVLSRLTEGDSNKLIARRVGIAEATVKTHIKGILRKIGVKNRTQAALWATNNVVPALDTSSKTGVGSEEAISIYEARGDLDSDGAREL